jgi:hypothetical protein
MSHGLGRGRATRGRGKVSMREREEDPGQAVIFNNDETKTKNSITG